jgi:hypothetical protein
LASFSEGDDELVTGAALRIRQLEAGGFERAIM